MENPKNFIVFFGCNQDAGHYLWETDHRQLGDERHPYVTNMKIPKACELDTSKLFLPYLEVMGDGVITYLPAPDRTIMAWWGNPFDTRGRVNNALISSGKHNEKIMWKRFSTIFPLLSAKLKRPRMVNGTEGLLGD